MHVSINTDDPPMFRTDLNREYAIAADLLDLDEAGLVALARTAVDGSFASDSTKQALRDELSAYVAPR